MNPARFEAGAWLRREVGCCTNSPNAVNCQPDLFGRGMFREVMQAIRWSTRHVLKGNDMLTSRAQKMWSARIWPKQASGQLGAFRSRSVSPNAVNCQPDLFRGGMLREAMQAIRCGIVPQGHDKFRERPVERHGVRALVRCSIAQAKTTKLNGKLG